MQVVGCRYGSHQNKRHEIRIDVPLSNKGRRFLLRAQLQYRLVPPPDG